MNSNDRPGALRAALLVLLLALPGAAAAQQAVGRFLIAVGTVTVERGAERITAATGTEVRKGDTVQVAAQSNAQLRFTDGSVMALRPGTTLRVTEYSYQQAGEKDGTAMDLIKGGLRTVTGLLGRSKPEEYQVRTPTATIGIRGTHYVLRVCDNDCEETTGTAQAGRIYLASAAAPVSDAGPIAQAAPAESRVPNGTYGTVSEGRISVSNQSGERQFGTDQVFHVASRSSAPQQLVAPPGFLRDRLDGRGRGERRSGQSQSPGGSSQQQQQQGDQSQSSGGAQQQGQAASSSSGSSSSSSGSEAAPTVAQTGQGAGNGDSRVSSGATTPVVSLAITPTLTQVTNQVSTAGPASVLELTGSSNNLVYRLASTSLNIPFQSVSCAGGCSPITAADFSIQVNPTSQTARLVIALRFADGGQLNINNSYGDFPVTLSGNQLVINGAANSADYPNSQGSFRCSDCGPGDTPGFLTRTEYSVTISGGQATLTVKITANNETGTFTMTVPQVVSTSTATAAIAGRNFGTNGGAQAYTQLNAAGQPVYIGEPLGIGANIVAIGSGTNQTLGSDASAGNLKWGTWTSVGTGTNAVNGVNGAYGSFSQAAGSVSPWITGELTNALPASLGTISFTPVGFVIGNGVGTAGTLNSTSFTADFANRNLGLSINATNAPGGGTYQMNGSASFSAINGRFSAGWTSISCTGVCGVAPITGGFTGFFAGANAAGAGVSFNANNATNGVFGAIGYKK